MKREFFIKSGVFFGTMMFFFVFSLVVAEGANSLPPRTVLAENAAIPVGNEAQSAEAVGADVAISAEQAEAEAAHANGQCTCYQGNEYVCDYGYGFGSGFFSGMYSGRMKIGGWVETGIYGNNHGAKSRFDNGEFIGTSGNSDRLGKLRSPGWQVQQAWLYAERALCEDRCGFDWGFRVDGMFGTDGFATQSWGDRTFDGNWNNRGEYAFSIPQMYVELAYNRLSVKLGKFMSPIGYEAIAAPDSKFYSHSYIYEHTPATHTGALFTFDYNECLALYGGVTTGADTGFGNRYGDIGVLLGFEAQVTTKVKLGYGFMWNQVHGGDWDDLRYRTPGSWDSGILNAPLFGPLYLPTAGLLPGQKGNEMLHNVVLTWTPTERLTIALEGNYGKVSKRQLQFAGGERQTMYENIGMALYSNYQLTHNLSVDLRGEWFRQNATMLGHGLTASPYLNQWRHQNCYEFTAALNYSPCEWLTIRPEIRYDSVHGDNNKVFNHGRSNTQVSGGVGIIAKF